MPGLPPGIDLAADDQNQIIGSVSATWALATIALVMRFLCRRISKAGYWWDDWLMIPAYVCFHNAHYHILLTNDSCSSSHLSHHGYQ
jgi:hypothetical protein